MGTQSVKDIAFKYFSDIIYIDDALKHPNEYIQYNLSMREQASASEKIQQDNTPKIYRRLPTKGIAQPTEIEERIKSDTSNVYPEDYSRAFNLLYQFQKLGCKASPYYFESVESIDQAVRLIEASHLSVLDWELDATGGETTLKLLDRALINKEKMKMIVIYTKSPQMARKSLHGKYPDCPPEKIKKERIEYDLVKLENAMILICNKEDFSAEDILNTFVDQIISSYGYFPFGFFDAINKMNDQTALIMQRFSYPFDNALILQLSSSGITQNDYAQIVSKMVTNHFNRETFINPVILESIIDNWKKAINRLLSNPDEQLISSIKSYIEEICNLHNKGKNGRKNVKNIKLLEEIPVDKWKNYLDMLNNLDLKIRDPFKQLKDEVIKEALEIKTNQELSKCKFNKELEESDSRIKESYCKLLSEKFAKEIKEVLGPLVPVIFVFLLSSKSSAATIKKSVKELVHIMKVLPYPNQTIDKVESLDDDQLVNYFSTGDVLFGDDQEVLVCISPSCDAFNPAEKVEHNLKFVCGTIIKKDTDFQRLKESQRLSVIPDPSGTGLLCVKWEYYKTKIMDIKNNFAEYKDYKRPYKFEQSYCQQIINSYLAYHSRSGVDELFFKNESSMRNFFLFPND
ncbi:response regulator receiver domain [Paenibacillus sp. RC84]|uniref:response regulator receiver domain n=1 Tax=Paenibacillus sp. RC84 TaxID=3156252 RepID=UPI0035165C71